MCAADAADAADAPDAGESVAKSVPMLLNSQISNSRYRLATVLSGNKTLIQEKILNAYILYAVFIPPWFYVVSYNYDFLEGIGDSDQRSNLLLLLFRIIDG